jgi:hypothetical protein
LTNRTLVKCGLEVNVLLEGAPLVGIAFISTGSPLRAPASQRDGAA